MGSIRSWIGLVVAALFCAMLGHGAVAAAAKPPPNFVLGPSLAAASIPPNMVMMPAVPITVRQKPLANITQFPKTGVVSASVVVKTPGRRPSSALTCTPPAAPNEIVELARALNWNPDLIYEYVHNNIQTLWVYDSLKGPLGTLVDQAGSVQDQAELMYVLLQQACYSPQYEVGSIYLTVAQLTNWLGTDANINSIATVLESNGFPTLTYYGTATAVTAVDVPWVWVTVPIPSGGTSYQFDPAGKVLVGGYGYSARSSGIASLGPTALGYSQSTFLSGAESGATGIGTPAISGINRTYVRQALTNFSSNLVSYIKANSPAATTTDVIGGSTISLLPPYTPPSSGPTTWGQTILCNVTISGVCYANGQRTAPTPTANLNAFRTTLVLTLGSNNSSGTFTALSGASVLTLNSSDIYGHRLSVQFGPATSFPSILLDGVTQTSASQAVPTGQQLTIRVSINHPHISNANISNSDEVRVTPAPGAVFVIGTGWGGSDRGMIEKHRKLLQQNTALNPGNPSAEAVLGEGLAMIGYSWLAEATRVQQRITELAGADTTYLHAIGIIGMKAVGASQGPYVDLPINIVGVFQRTNHPASTAPTPAETSAFVVESGMASVLESGSIEQTQPSAVAASTTKLLDLWSQSGAILDINNAAISSDDCAAYKAPGGIRSLMTGYGAADQARIDSLVGYNAGTGVCSASTTRVVTPSNGTLTVSQWTGTGYLQILYDSTQTVVQGIGSIITGGLSGGEPATPVTPPQINDNQGGVQSGATYVPPSSLASSSVSETNVNVAAAGGGASLGVGRVGGDPLNLVTGGFTYSKQDLSVGSGAYPDTLPFVRLFDSGLALSGRNSSLLGVGWMHNYDMTTLPDSDGFEGMGDNSPISGAASIAALYVVQDILNLQTNTLKPTDRMIVASQVEYWLMQQLTNNIAAVTLPGNIERFTLLPNGLYNPPIGSASVITGSASTGYTYQSGRGVTLTFNSTSASASGKVASWANAAGAAVGFSYNSSGQLQTVCKPNCTAPARQLNFQYTGNSLTAVNDNAGGAPRTVSFGYDGQGNLTSVSDPLGTPTRYGYAGVGQLAQIYYPANPGSPFISQTYDTLGRPNQQTDALGHVSTLHFAGTRTEIIDPVGTSRVSYYTARGKTLATIDGLGSAGINSGAGNLTSYTYDGLDRALTVTLPEGGKQAFTYDAYNNPLTIVSTPKPGSPLGALTQSFTYTSPVASLPNFEELQTATDPRSVVTRYGYDSKGNRISTTADAGGAGHVNATSQSTYDGFGRVLTATDPLGAVTLSAYDNQGNLTSLTRDYGRLNITSRYGYDLVGNATSATDPNGNVTTGTYDADRRPLTTTAPGTGGGILVTSLAYDANGQLLSTTQSAGGSLLASTAASYTVSGKAAASTDANGNVTRYAYDTADRLLTVTDPIGNVTTYGYDALSRKTSTSNLAIQSNPLVSQTYTGDGLVGSISIWRNNTAPDVTSYTFDGFDRLSTTTYPNGGSGVTSESLTYDAGGNVLARTTRKGDVIAFAYDALNRVCTKTYAATAVACGGTSAGYLVSYAYDLDGRLLAANDNSAAVTLPAASGSFTQSAAFDALNHPVSFSWSPAAAQTPPASSSSVTFTHGYDADNRRISQAANDNSWLQYPGPTSSTSYTANALNQYTAVGAASPTYDSNGNLAFDGTFTYAYDAESHLTAIKQGATTVATYAYDAQGRRKSKTVGAVVTAYVTDADNREVLELDGTSGALNVWTAFGAGPDAALNQMNLVASTRTTLIPDIQSSIIAALSSGGTLTKTAYQSFGENPALTANGFFYAGRRLDPETAGATAQPSGLYYDRARMYSPTWGRFLQADPAGYGAGPNLYTYALNNPLSFTDPSGQTPDGSLPSDSISTVSFTPQEVVVTAQRVYPQYTGLGTPWNSPTNLALGGAAAVIVGAGIVPEAISAVVTTARLVQGLTVGASAAEEAGLAAKSAYQLGVEGETAVRGAFDIGDKVAIDLGGRTIVPDGLNATTLSEVKNVGYQSFTGQLRTYSNFAETNGLNFNLYLRPDTTVSRTLQNAFDNGLINRFDIPQ